MGLRIVRLQETNDEPACWSYSGFHHFRIRVAAAVGLNLDAIYDADSKEPRFDWNSLPDGPAEGLVPLLNHPDNEGTLGSGECEDVARALRPIVESWPEHDYDRKQGLNLVLMMERCAKEGALLEFR